MPPSIPSSSLPPRTGRRVALCLLALALALPAVAQSEAWVWGGILPSNRTRNVRLQAGAIVQFEGVVAETTRRVYEVTGATQSQARAQTVTTDDFNMEGPFGTAGLSLDMAWSFFRLSIDTLFLNPSVSAQAKRDYYLRVGEDLSFQGVSYDNLKIPKGSRFYSEVFGNVTELTLSFVPFGVHIGDWVAIQPSLDFGAMLFLGRYEIDAGLSTGVVQYLNPPEDYVVGGHASGFVGMGAPQWGPGLQVRLGPPGDIAVSLQAHYLMMSYDGGSAFFTTADHREKNLDFRHRNLRLGGQVEIPLRRGAWTLGVQARFVDSEGSVTTTATDPQVVLERRERFDKDFSFKLDSFLFTLGVSF